MTAHRTTFDSDNVIQARLQDAKDALSAAQADVLEVDGLMAKIEARNTTQDAYEAAVGATAEANADAQGAVATFDARAARADDNADATYVAPAAGAEDVDVVTDAGNGGAAMIRINAEGELVIEDAYTDTVGINELYTAVEAHVAAIEAEAAAEEARDEAAAAVSAGNETALNSEFAADKAAFEEAQTNVADFGAESTAFTNAQADLTDFNALVTTYNDALAAYNATADATTQSDLSSAYDALNTYDATDFPAIADGDTSGTNADEIAAANTTTQAAIGTEVTALEGPIDTAAVALFVETTVDVTGAYTADYSAEITAEGTARDNALTTAADELFVLTEEPADLTAGLADEIAAEGIAREEAAEDAVATQALVDTYDQELADLETAQGVIETREELIAEANATESLNAEADALAEAIVEADAALTDSEEEGGLGVTLLEGANNFTSEDDVYLFAESEGDQVLTGFGASGEDKIFFGEGFSLVELGDDAITDNVGDAGALEIFWEQDGNNVNLYVETETFGGSASGQDDVTQVTLTGVDAANINDQLSTGFLTAGEVA
ncbi:hypothetical protein LG290_11915 [Halomonas sediminis]